MGIDLLRKHEPPTIPTDGQLNNAQRERDAQGAAQVTAEWERLNALYKQYTACGDLAKALDIQYQMTILVSQDGN